MTMRRNATLCTLVLLMGLAALAMPGTQAQALPGMRIAINGNVTEALFLK